MGTVDGRWTRNNAHPRRPNSQLRRAQQSLRRIYRRKDDVNNLFFKCNFDSPLPSELFRFQRPNIGKPPRSLYVDNPMWTQFVAHVDEQLGLGAPPRTGHPAVAADASPRTAGLRVAQPPFRVVPFWYRSKNDESEHRRRSHAVEAYRQLLDEKGLCIEPTGFRSTYYLPASIDLGVRSQSLVSRNSDLALTIAAPPSCAFDARMISAHDPEGRIVHLPVQIEMDGVVPASDVWLVHIDSV